MKRTYLRTAATYATYETDMRTNPNHRSEHTFNNSSDTIVREFEHWLIIKNNYPYDAVAETHDMLVPKRIFGSLDEATPAEREEYESILTLLTDEDDYDALQINFSKNRSVLRHFHIHLLVWKKINPEV